MNPHTFRRTGAITQLEGDVPRQRTPDHGSGAEVTAKALAARLGRAGHV